MQEVSKTIKVSFDNKSIFIFDSAVSMKCNNSSIKTIVHYLVILPNYICLRDAGSRYFVLVLFKQVWLCKLGRKRMLGLWKQVSSVFVIISFPLIIMILYPKHCVNCFVSYLDRYHSLNGIFWKEPSNILFVLENLLKIIYVINNLRTLRTMILLF